MPRPASIGKTKVTTTNVRSPQIRSTIQKSSANTISSYTDTKTGYNNNTNIKKTITKPGTKIATETYNFNQTLKQTDTKTGSKKEIYNSPSQTSQIQKNVGNLSGTFLGGKEYSPDELFAKYSKYQDFEDIKFDDMETYLKNSNYKISSKEIDTMVSEKKKINKFIFNKKDNDLKNKQKEIDGLTKQSITGKNTNITEKYPLLLISPSGIPYTYEQFKRLKNSNNKRNNNATKTKQISDKEYEKQYNAYLKESSKEYFADSKYSDLKGISVDYKEYKEIKKENKIEQELLKQEKYHNDQVIKAMPYTIMIETSNEYQKYKNTYNPQKAENILKNQNNDIIGSNISGSSKERTIFQKNYEYLTENQKEAYCFLYEKEGKLAAEKYLMSIEDEINQEKGRISAERFLNTINNYDKEKEAQYVEMLYSYDYMDFVSKGNYTSFDRIMNSENANSSLRKYASSLNESDKLLCEYLYNKGGKAAIYEYINTIEGRLTADFGDYLLTTGRGLFDGINTWADGVKSIFREDGIMTSNQYAQQHITEGINGRGALSGTYEISVSMGNMIPSITTAAVISAVIPGAGTTILFAPLGEEVTAASLMAQLTMGAGIYGNSKNQALVKGSDLLTAQGYGIINALSEITTGTLIGNIPGLNANSSLSLTGILKEGVEEGIQEFIGAFNDYLYFGETRDISELGSDALKAFIYGAITSGVMNGGQVGLTVAYNGVNYTLSTVKDVVNFESKIQQEQTAPKVLPQENNNTRKIDSEHGFQVTTEDMDKFYTDRLKIGFFKPEQINSMITSANSKGYISENTGKYIEGLFDGKSDIYIKTVYSSDVESIMSEGIRCLGTSTSGFGSAPTDIKSINLENTITPANCIYDLTVTSKNAIGISQGGNPINGTLVIKVPKGVDMQSILYYNNDSKVFCIAPQYVDSFLQVDNNGIVSEPIFNEIDTEKIDSEGNKLLVEHNSETEIRTIKDEIFERMPQNLDNLTKLRYLYIELSKRLNYDVGYFAKGEQAVESFGKILNFENMVDNKVVCKGWSELFADLVKSAGIEENKITIRRAYNNYDQPGHPTGQHRWVEIDFDDYIIRADPTDAFNHTFDLSAIKSGSQTYGFIAINKADAGKRITSADIENWLKNGNLDFNWLRTIDEQLGYTIDGKYYNERAESITDDFYSPSIVEKIFGINQEKIEIAKTRYFLETEIPKNMNAYDAFSYFRNLKSMLFENTSKIGSKINFHLKCIETSPNNYCGVSIILINNTDGSISCRMVLDGGFDYVYKFNNLNEYIDFLHQNKIMSFKE